MTTDHPSVGIFIAIPEAGGETFLHTYLPAVLPADELYLAQGTAEECAEAEAALASLTLEQRGRLRFVSGCHDVDLPALFPKRWYCALFRDPRSQLASMLVHLEDLAPHPQCRAIAALGEDGTTALSRIEAVGLTEQLDLFLFSLHLRYRFPLLLFHHQNRREEQAAVERPAAPMADLRSVHAGDFELYDAAKAQFEQDIDAMMGPCEMALWEAYRRELCEFRTSHQSDLNRCELVDRLVLSAKYAEVDRPLVSVVTPCFNSASYIEDCIRSVQDQDYEHVEHVVHDGGSSDGTVEILRRYRDDVNWVSAPDRGESDGLDRALKRCRGEVIVVLNSDDMLLPHACSWAVEQLTRHPDVAAIYGDQFLINPFGEIIGLVNGPDPYDYAKLICVEQVPPAQASFIRRAHLHAVGLRADISLATCPDHEMWLRLGQFPIRHVTGRVTRYRWHPEGKGRQAKVVNQMLRDKRRVNDRLFADARTPASIRTLRRRARASLHFWGASMFIDACDPLRACLHMLLGFAIAPSSRSFELWLRCWRHWAGLSAQRLAWPPTDWPPTD